MRKYQLLGLVAKLFSRPSYKIAGQRTGINLRTSGSIVKLVIPSLIWERVWRQNALS